MREDFFEFESQLTIFLAANHRPEVRGTDHAMWRRLHLVPFNVTIPEANRDRHMVEKLREEAPGILAWAVRGCLEYQHSGLQPPNCVLAATKRYHDDSDVLAGFLADSCVLRAGVDAMGSELHAAYKQWAERAGEPVISQKEFALRLREKGVESTRVSAGIRWLGVGLRTPHPTSEGPLLSSDDDADVGSAPIFNITDSSALHAPEIPEMGTSAYTLHPAESPEAIADLETIL